MPTTTPPSSYPLGYYILLRSSTYWSRLPTYPTYTSRAMPSTMRSSRLESPRIQRRDSSPRSASKRRPKLLRAAATEPSITTSNASRNALATPQACGRATELLNRVAIVSGSPPESAMRSVSPLSSRSPMYDRQGDVPGSPSSQEEAFDGAHAHHRKLPAVHIRSRSPSPPFFLLGCYWYYHFSYPSFIWLTSLATCQIRADISAFPASTCMKYPLKKKKTRRPR